MGKGTRSKIKRKHRSEFRRTIGEDAAAKNREIIQQKLKECMDKGNMNSFEKLSNVFQMGDDTPEKGNDSPNVLPVDAMDTTGESTSKVETKLPPGKKSRKKKHHLKNKPKNADKLSKPERRKPKYFCEF
mmetsp:Transcript_552/g.625  ORF Transcript_552/g.625 Transcript_552/m.625 type:complete len:130 (-) Transcript_552:216-605(-)